MNDTTQNPAVPDDFESPLVDTLTITRRGQSRTYRFTEVNEERMQSINKVDPSEFGNQLVAATVVDEAGEPISSERLQRMPAGIAIKLRLKALEVNGYAEGEAATAGEA